MANLRNWEFCELPNTRRSIGLFKAEPPILGVEEARKHGLPSVWDLYAIDDRSPTPSKPPERSRMLRSMRPKKRRRASRTVIVKDPDGLIVPPPLPKVFNATMAEALRKAGIAQ